MWFGVAPSPAPSPSRPNTQTWHQPNCTCARHRDAATDAPLSPRAQFVLSPRTQHADAKASGGSVASRLTAKENQVQASAVTTAVGGPTPPRMSRAQAMRVALLARTQPQPQPQQEQHYAAKTGPTLASRRAAQAHTQSALKAAEEEPAAALDGSQPPLLDDSLLSNNSDATTADGNADSGARAVLPDDDVVVATAAERKMLHSGRRVSRVVEYVQTGVRPPTVHVDAGGRPRLEPINTPPAPPKSRRSSRIYSTCISGVEQQPEQSQWTPANEYATTARRMNPQPQQPENLVGHTSSVCAVAAHDDRYIVSCSVDGSVKVWSRASSRCLHTLFGHRDSVSCVDLHARWLVSGSHDATLRVYSCVDAFALLHVLAGHTAHVTSVQLPPALPQLIVSGADDATIRVWSGDLGLCLFVLRDHTSRITCVVIMGTAPRVCSGAADAAICFWDLPPALTSTLLPALSAATRDVRATRVFRVHTAPVQALVAHSSADGTLVLSGSTDGTIQIFNLDTAEYVGCLDHARSPIYSMCALAAGQLVCSTRDGRLLHFSDLYSHPIVKSELRLASKWISRLQPRGTALVCCSEDLLFVVDAERLRVRAVLESQHGFVTTVGWLHTRALVSAGQDNVIKIWHLA